MDSCERREVVLSLLCQVVVPSACGSRFLSSLRNQQKLNLHDTFYKRYVAELHERIRFAELEEFLR